MVAGGVAAAGYYSVLADEAEQRKMEGYLAQAKAMVGLGGEAEKAAASSVVKGERKTQQPPPHQVGTFLHDVKEGAVHATEGVKGQLKRVSGRICGWSIGGSHTHAHKLIPSSIPQSNRR